MAPELHVYVCIVIEQKEAYWVNPLPTIGNSLKKQNSRINA